MRKFNKNKRFKENYFEMRMMDKSPSSFKQQVKKKRKSQIPLSPISSTQTCSSPQKKRKQDNSPTITLNSEDLPNLKDSFFCGYSNNITQHCPSLPVDNNESHPCNSLTNGVNNSHKTPVDWSRLLPLKPVHEEEIIQEWDNIQKRNHLLSNLYGIPPHKWCGKNLQHHIKWSTLSVMIVDIKKMNFDTGFALLQGEVMSTLGLIDVSSGDDVSILQRGKIPLSTVNHQFMHIASKFKDSSIPNIQKIHFISMLVTQNIDLFYTFFGAIETRSSFLLPSDFWNILEIGINIPKKDRSPLNDATLIIYNVLQQLSATSLDKFFRFFPDVLFDFLLVPPRKVDDVEDETMRIYEHPLGKGFGYLISQNIMGWYQKAIDNMKDQAEILKMDSETFNKFLELLKDRLFMLIVESLKAKIDDRMVVVGFVDVLCDFFGSMRLIEREQFIFQSDKHETSESFSLSSESSFQERNLNVDLIDKLYLASDYDREEQVEFIVEAFSSHKSKKIRDSLNAMFGPNLMKKIKKRIHTRKIQTLKNSKQILKNPSYDEYLLTICEFNGRKRKFKIRNVNSVHELQQQLVNSYSNRKRSSHALSSCRDDSKYILQMLLENNSVLDSESKDESVAGDWVDLDDFNMLQMSFFNNETKEIIKEVINQVRLIKKVSTKVETVENSVISNSFIPSSYEQDNTAFATKGSSGNTTLKAQFSDQTSNQTSGLISVGEMSGMSAFGKFGNSEATKTTTNDGTEHGSTISIQEMSAMSSFGEFVPKSEQPESFQGSFIDAANQISSMEPMSFLEMSSLEVDHNLSDDEN